MKKIHAHRYEARCVSRFVVCLRDNNTGKLLTVRTEDQFMAVKPIQTNVEPQTALKSDAVAPHQTKPFLYSAVGILCVFMDTFVSANK